MKRLLFINLGLALCCLLSAANRNPQAAAESAATFYATNQNEALQKAPAQQRTLKLAHTRIMAGSTNAAFYVFNRGTNGGFVIVSGDDRAREILGYADSGSFDAANLPINMQEWLNGYQTEMEHIDQTTTVAAKQAPQKVEDKFKTVAPLLNGILWNQDAPYNNLCPLYDGTHTAVTGCSATAMAQIMYYYKWPAVGRGSNSYTTSSYHLSVSANFASIPLDWENMTPTYNSSSTTPQNAAVAKLMYACGVSINMDYGPSSGASLNSIANALVQNFDYDTDIQLLYRSNYNSQAWDALMKNELNNKRPILYSGSTANTPVSGHAFVCDGYDMDGLYHINWGWGGQSNGYFALSALTPATQGIGGSTGEGYNTGQIVLIGIQKPDSVKSVAPVLYTENIVADTNCYARNAQIKCTLSIVKNIGTDSINTKYGPTLYTTDWALVKTLTTSQITGLKSGCFYSTLNRTCTIPTSIPNGFYRLCNAYQLTDSIYSNEWQPTAGPAGETAYLDIEVRDDSILITRPNTEPALQLISMNVGSTLYQNKTGVYNFRLTNTGREYNDNIMVCLQNTTTHVTTIGSNNPVVIATGDTLDFNFTETVTVAPGEYMLQLAYMNADTKYYLTNSTLVTVLPTPVSTSPNLAIVGTGSFSTASNAVPKNDVVFTTTITNSGDYFDNAICAFIFTGAGSSIASLGQQQLTLAKNETKTLQFGNSLDLPEGNYLLYLFYVLNNTWKQLGWNNGFTLVAAQTSALSLNAAISFSDNSHVDTDNAVLTANLTNTGAAYKGALSVGIYTADTLTQLCWLDQQAFSLAKGGSTELTFGSTLNLPAGTYIAKLLYKEGDAWLPVASESNSTISFTIQESAPTGLSDNAAMQMQLYPNPATETLFVNNAQGLIQISDLCGRLVLTIPATQGTTRIDVNVLPQGTYLVRTGNSVAKFSKR